MQLFFNDSIQQARIAVKDPLWGYIKSGLERNLQVTMDYYKTKGFAVRTNHLLVKLVNSIGVDYELNIERFYSIVNAKTNRIGMHFKFTSPIYTGQYFNGVFYGAGTKEIIIADDEYVNPYLVQEKWKDYASVTVLDHPRSDLDMILPTGRVTGIETGLAVIKINIAALAIQYKMYLREQYEKVGNAGSEGTAAMFVHKYVLPNMLPSHLDVALFNRIDNMALGKPMGIATVRHPFFLIDFTDRVDKVYWQLEKYFNKTELNFHSIMKSIPLVTAPNLDTLMLLPEIAPTRQYAWAEFMTRLKCIEFLIKINPSHGRVSSMHDLNHILRKIKLFSSDRTLEQVHDSEIDNNRYRSIKDILMLTGSDNTIKM